ncbi:MAG: UDP-N-acetylmuramoyl-tripeptide--D-alanyl-D-alanine ligase [Treponema sp.]|nr:UDP-N-acetylmuramoyl-tripeptide--D-alanyl-D-alanine ligase [Treponema sp.]
MGFLPRLMSFNELSAALGADLFAGEGKQVSLSNTDGFSSVCIDSRTAGEDCLFVALKGEFQDGHRFIEEAFAAGAGGAIIAKTALNDAVLDLEKIANKFNKILIPVEDTLKALQKAAATYLRKFPNLLRIGITGSAGKTTTKEIAAKIISFEKSIIMNKGNLNSETGLPLSVFEVRSHHSIGIFEAAMNRPGEMTALAEILNPHVALITNIGSAHIGYLGSRERIAEEKKQIFSFFSGNNTAMIPIEDDFKDFLAKDVKGKIVFYGPSTLSPLGEIRDLGLKGSEITWDNKPVVFGLPGKFNVQNALSAAALAMELSMSSSSICKGIESVKPLFGRGEIFKGRTTLIRDCYNSSPESAYQAIDFFEDVSWPGRKIYIMGSMLELGDLTPKAHSDLGLKLASVGKDKVFLYGKETEITADILAKASVPFFHTLEREELSIALDEFVKDGDLVLLKASRGCALESLTEVLVGRNASVL